MNSETENHENSPSIRQYKIEEESERVLRPGQLEEGMVLSRDVETRAGQLLYRKGTTLDDKKVSRLHTFEVFQIPVVDSTVRWVDESTYRNLQDSVNVLDERERPAESLSNENSKQSSDAGPETESIEEFLNKIGFPSSLLDSSGPFREERGPQGILGQLRDVLRDFKERDQLPENLNDWYERLEWDEGADSSKRSRSELQSHRSTVAGDDNHTEESRDQSSVRGDFNQDADGTTSEAVNVLRDVMESLETEEQSSSAKSLIEFFERQPGTQIAEVMKEFEEEFQQQDGGQSEIRTLINDVLTDADTDPAPRNSRKESETTSHDTSEESGVSGKQRGFEDVDPEGRVVRVIGFLEDILDQTTSRLEEMPGEKRDEVKDQFREIIERYMEQRLDVTEKQSLVERDTVNDENAGDQERLREVVQQDNIRAIKEINRLPDEIIDLIEEFYSEDRVPEQLDKWQRTLFDFVQELIRRSTLETRVPRDLVERFLYKTETIYENNSKPYSLFVQPPNPDHYHLVHAYNNAILSLFVGWDLNFSRSIVESLLFGALLGDVGMTVVPDSLYLKRPELSRRAWREIRKHPLYTRKIVRHIFGSEHPVCEIVSQHHERLDGSGYPHRLVEKELHPLGPIFSVIDVYTARIENRIYRGGEMPDQVLFDLEDQSGQYKSTAVDAIRNVLGYYPNGSLVRLSNNSLAYVRSQCSEQPRNPDVITLTDTRRNRLDEPKPLSLRESENTDVSIIIKVG